MMSELLPSKTVMQLLQSAHMELCGSIVTDQVMRARGHLAEAIQRMSTTVETPAPQKVEGCAYCDGGDAPCVGHGGLKVPGHFWTCVCGYVNNAAIRFNRCGRCKAFQQSQVKTSGKAAL